MLLASEVIKQSGISFGTSGARGLVEKFTPDVCAAFTHAFIEGIRQDYTIARLAIAIDNRPSSLDIAKSCIAALQQRGIDFVYYGVIPTPALAYFSMKQSIPCIMVTGSHIPFDRNGLKFYTPDGEITKVDENKILNASYQFLPLIEFPQLNADAEAAQQYINRYTRLFDEKILSGMRLGIYEHSSAGRDIYKELFATLGAEVISIERSDIFVPIDTEAVSDEDKIKAKKWSELYQLDAIFSTDGDGDRPLVADENGQWIRGDILGVLCAELIGIDALAIPISCNSIIERSSKFKTITRTRIGSPYVIAEFDKLSNLYQTVAGFEANGGFLLGTDVNINGNTLDALPTRDAILPAIILLSAAKEDKISTLINKFSARQTYSDRLQGFPIKLSLKILEQGKKDPQSLLKLIGLESQSVVSVNLIDGVRLYLSSGDIIHLRPSGNAPELRCYGESSSFDKAKKLVDLVLSEIRLVVL